MRRGPVAPCSDTACGNTGFKHMEAQMGGDILYLGVCLHTCKHTRRVQTYCINTGQLHPDVDHCDGDDLPAKAAV